MVMVMVGVGVEEEDHLFVAAHTVFSPTLHIVLSCALFSQKTAL
jgi:hypothetical protein